MCMCAQSLSLCRNCASIELSRSSCRCVMGLSRDRSDARQRSLASAARGSRWAPRRGDSLRTAEGCARRAGQRAPAPTLCTVPATPEKLLLAWPRGYVRKEIVHNRHVVEQLRRRGAVFVESEQEVPEGATIVFSAHGVAPEVYENAARRRLRTIDATCPLVTKVHREAVKFAAEGYTIVLIGHAGHEEVEGTMGEAPGQIVLVESVEDVERLEVEDPERIAYISQTTLSVDETRAMIEALRRRFPAIVGPRTDDICYATTNRQAAVKQLARRCDLVLVIGSRNSSNSNRLVEVARECGADSHLIDNETQVRKEWLVDRPVVGVTSGASAPEDLVQRLVEFFRARGTRVVEELDVVQEDVRFMLPKVIRQALAAAPSA